MIVGVLEKNYVAEHIPPITLTLDDCEAVKNSLHVGQTIEIETPVWLDNTIQAKKRLKATIDHVGKKGIRVWFWHRNWKELTQCYRWISYVQIVMDRRAGKLPFANVGGRSTI